MPEMRTHHINEHRNQRPTARQVRRNPAPLAAAATNGVVLGRYRPLMGLASDGVIGLPTGKNQAVGKAGNENKGIIIQRIMLIHELTCMIKIFQ